VIGFSKIVPQYPFPILDPARIITIPVRNVSAPAQWAKPGTTHRESTAAADWIKKTWPSAKA
jgi:branched-chain amino acid transport system substrate-binding protein